MKVSCGVSEFALRSMPHRLRLSGFRRRRPAAFSRVGIPDVLGSQNLPHVLRGPREQRRRLSPGDF